MKKQSIIISKKDIIREITGWAYYLSPGCRPREGAIDKIAEFLRNHLPSEDVSTLTFDDRNQLMVYLKNILLECKEFTQLNISQARWDKGVRDFRSNEFVDKDPKISKEYYDFVDLDALLQDAATSLMVESCFDNAPIYHGTVTCNIHL